jgi:hypothetical protein
LKERFSISPVGVFIHNHFSVDDCAYGISQNGHHAVPLAKVAYNMYLGSTEYYELSIMFGYFEVLVTGGYFTISDGPAQPFLGSSITHRKHGEKSATQIHVIPSDERFSLAMAERLLNHERRDSYNTRGFHSLYVCQKKKTPTVHHFASNLLLVTTRLHVVTKYCMVDIFLRLANTKP